VCDRHSILSQTGPLATTSANLSGQLPLQTMAEITVSRCPDFQPTELVAVNPGVAFLPQLLNGRVVVGKFWQGAVKLEF